MVVIEVRTKNSLEMSFIEDDDVVEAFATDTADQAFHEWILPGRSPSRNEFLDTQVLYAIAKVRAVDTILIAYQKARRSLFGKYLGNLLCRPLSGWMFGHVEMNNHPAVMSQHNKSEKQSEQ